MSAWCVVCEGILTRSGLCLKCGREHKPSEELPFTDSGRVESDRLHLFNGHPLWSVSLDRLDSIAAMNHHTARYYR